MSSAAAAERDGSSFSPSTARRSLQKCTEALSRQVAATARWNGSGDNDPEAFSAAAKILLIIDRRHGRYYVNDLLPNVESVFSAAVSRTMCETGCLPILYFRFEDS